MPFTKGTPKPIGSGKIKGSKNKKTLQWEAIGDFIISDGAERACKIMRESNDKDFMFYFSLFVEYFKPKLARQELTGKDGGKIKISVSLKKSDE